MTGGASDSEVWALRQELATVRDNIRKRTLKQRILMAEAEPDESDPGGDDCLTEAAAQPAVETTLRQELEKQRDSTESSFEFIAERLGQQVEALSSVRRVLDGMGERLDRQADAIRSLSELQAQQATALKLLLEALAGGGRR